MKNCLKNSLPNALTFTRIILTAMFIGTLNSKLILGIETQSISFLAVMFLAICATDFLDGKIARWLKVSSVAGSRFDVMADFIFILSATALLVKFQLMPLWFLVVIIAKLLDFIVSSKIVNYYKFEKQNTFVFDFMGRGAAILFYLLPFLVIFFSRYMSEISTSLALTLIALTSFVALISSTQRMFMCFQLVRKAEMKYLERREN